MKGSIAALVFSCLSSVVLPTQSHGHGKNCPPGFIGYLPHPNNCFKFLHCHYGKIVIKDCDSGKSFDRKTRTCVWPANVRSCLHDDIVEGFVKKIDTGGIHGGGGYDKKKPYTYGQELHALPGFTGVLHNTNGYPPRDILIVAYITPVNVEEPNRGGFDPVHAGQVYAENGHTTKGYSGQLKPAPESALKISVEEVYDEEENTTETSKVILKTEEENTTERSKEILNTEEENTTETSKKIPNDRPALDNPVNAVLGSEQKRGDVENSKITFHERDYVKEGLNNEGLIDIRFG